MRRRCRESRRSNVVVETTAVQVTTPASSSVHRSLPLYRTMCYRAAAAAAAAAATITARLRRTIARSFTAVFCVCARERVAAASIHSLNNAQPTPAINRRRPNDSSQYFSPSIIGHSEIPAARNNVQRNERNRITAACSMSLR